MRIDQFVNLVDENFEGSDFNQGTFIQRQLVRRDHVDTLITSRVRAEESQRRFLTAIGASVLIRSRRTLSQQMGAHATLVHSNGIIGADGNGTRAIEKDHRSIAMAPCYSHARIPVRSFAILPPLHCHYFRPCHALPFSSVMVPFYCHALPFSIVMLLFLFMHPLPFHALSRFHAPIHFSVVILPFHSQLSLHHSQLSCSHYNCHAPVPLSCSFCHLSHAPLIVICHVPLPLG